MKWFVFLIITLGVLSSCGKDTAVTKPAVDSKEDQSTADSKEDQETVSEFLVACDEWTHPSSKNNVITVNPDTTYNIDQALSVTLSPSALKADTAWSETELKDNDYTGKNTAFVKINIPEDGDYTVWLTIKSFITPYHSQGQDKPLVGGKYIGPCKKELAEGGYLKAVMFSLKKGLNTIQLSHSKESQAVLTVAKSE